jgi:hypothetical protein
MGGAIGLRGGGCSASFAILPGLWQEHRMSTERTAAAVALTQLWTHSTTPLVTNLRGQMDTVAVNGERLPYSLCDRADVPNCYICCPTVAYRDYGIAETRHFARTPFLRGLFISLLRATGPLLRQTGLDHQCQLNNWLLATNPPLDLSVDATLLLLKTLAKQYPDRAITIRSLNDAMDGALIDGLRQAGVALIAARQVWLLQPGQTRWSANRHRDAVLLERTSLRIVGDESFDAADFASASQLYAMLYLQKYTPLNPQYTASFLRGMRDAGILRLTGLRAADGILVGVIGTVALQGVLTAPVVGYRTDYPQKAGLYRMLIARAMAEAELRGIPFNISAGAASFKRNRGARPAIEYTAAYVAHLPRPARLATALMAACLDRIGVPIMRKYAL